MSLAETYAKKAGNTRKNEQELKQFLQKTLESKFGGWTSNVPLTKVDTPEEQQAAVNLMKIYEDETQIDRHTASLLNEAIPLIEKNKWRVFNPQTLYSSENYSHSVRVKLLKKHLFGSNTYKTEAPNAERGMSLYYRSWYHGAILECQQLMRYLWADGSSHLYYGGCGRSVTVPDGIVIDASNEDEAIDKVVSPIIQTLSNEIRLIKFHYCQEYVLFPYQIIKEPELDRSYPRCCAYYYILYKDGTVYHYVETLRNDTSLSYFEDPSMNHPTWDNHGIRTIGNKKRPLTEENVAELLLKINSSK